MLLNSLSVREAADMDEMIFSIKMSNILSCLMLIFVKHWSDLTNWKWQTLENSWATSPILEKMSGRPRSCVTAPNQHNQGVPPYFSISATCYLSEYWFVILLIIIVTVVNRLSGEVLVGIYKRRCNREKTRTWALNQQCPIARPCRFLQKKLPCLYFSMSGHMGQFLQDGKMSV